MASTTWHQHFYCLESESRREELWLLPREEQADMLSAPSDPDVETLASTSVSFSMVRHPFERLVSAYQDKVVRRIIMFLRWILFQIADNPEGHLRLWKGVYKMIELQYGDKTFPSFVKWLVGWKVETPLRDLSYKKIKSYLLIYRRFTKTCAQTLMKIRQ